MKKEKRFTHEVTDSDPRIDFRDVGEYDVMVCSKCGSSLTPVVIGGDFRRIRYATDHNCKIFCPIYWADSHERNVAITNWTEDAEPNWVPEHQPPKDGWKHIPSYTASLGVSGSIRIYQKENVLYPQTGRGR